MAVTRYYLDIRDGEQLLRDDEGTEFDSLDAATHGAGAFSWEGEARN
jgi:hypothetical protein